MAMTLYWLRVTFGGSLGLNWYLATRTRVTFNYIHAFLDRNNIASEADIFGTRFQVAW